MEPDDLDVRWFCVPPHLLLDVLATLESLQREVQVSGLSGDAPVVSDVERSLVEDRTRIRDQRNHMHDQATAARAEGRTTVDVAVTYSREEVTLVLSAAEAVARADAAAGRGELLVPPMTAEERDLWDWLVSEIREQAGGAAPTPYRGRW